MDSKRYSIAVVFLALLLSLTACGPRFYVDRLNIKTSYKKWVKEIGLFSHENINVWRYVEDKGKIELEINYDNGLEGYKELSEIINAHNKFVEENPDYFPDDIAIDIINIDGSEWINSFFGNFTKDDIYPAELGINCNSKMQFVSINIGECMGEELEPTDDIHFCVPVVILGCDYVPSNEEYAFLTEFDKAEQIIFSYEDDNYDKDEVGKAIKAYLPNVEIYESVYDGEHSHLQKIQ